MDWGDPNTAKKYKDKAEGLTGPFALQLVQQCSLDRADGREELVILDNACGTGIVTHHIYNTLSPAAKAKLQVVCGDLSPWMVKSVQERIQENGWAGASAQIVDAWRMDLPSNHFTHVLTNFALTDFAQSYTFLTEAFRVLRPSGVIGLTIFERVGWLPIAAAAIARIPNPPRVPTLKERVKEDEDWTDPEFITEEMRKAGFEDVQTVLHKNVSKVPNIEEYLMLHGELTVLARTWTEEEKARVSPHFHAALRDELKSRFGEGEISLEWGAWGITGRVPVNKA